MVADVTVPVVVSRGGDRQVPAVVIWRPLKVATPLAAATEVVVPPAKLARGQRHVEGVVRAGVPVVIDVAELVLDGHADRDRAAGSDGRRLGGDGQFVLADQATP